MTMNGATVRVAVVAEFPAMRAGLRALLAPADGIEVTAELDPARLAVGDWAGEADLLLVYVGGADDATTESARTNDLPLVALVEDVEAGLALLAGDRPPAGVLLRDSDAEQLAAAVRTAAAGLVALAPQIAARSFTSRRGPASPGGEGESLSPREHEVLRLVALGLPNKAIAQRLGISENTAKFHVGTILGKLGAASRTEAVMIAARRGWLPI